MISAFVITVLLMWVLHVLAVNDWLQVFAKHVGFDECVTAAVETLLTGLPLAAFGCSTCGATHLDADKSVQKLHTCHVCSVCNHC